MKQLNEARLLGGVVSLSLIVSITGCSPSWSQYSESSLIDLPEQISRPIDDYMLSADEIVELAHRTEQSVNECLSANGFEPTFQYPNDDVIYDFSTTVIQDRKTRGDVWGFFDPGLAPKIGYQRPESTTNLQISPLPAGAECGQLMQDDQDPIMKSSYASLPGGGPALAQSDAVATALSGWSRCMKTAGYDYASVLDPLREFVEETTATERQIETALADIQCKTETNLVAAVLDAQVTIDETYIKQHHEELSELEAGRFGRLRAVADALETSPPVQR